MNVFIWFLNKSVYCSWRILCLRSLYCERFINYSFTSWLFLDKLDYNSKVNRSELQIKFETIIVHYWKTIQMNGSILESRTTSKNQLIDLCQGRGLVKIWEISSAKAATPQLVGCWRSGHDLHTYYSSEDPLFWKFRRKRVAAVININASRFQVCM